MGKDVLAFRGDPNSGRRGSGRSTRGPARPELDLAPSTTVPPPLPSPIANFTGALHSSEGKVTGTFRALATPTGSQCVDIFTNLPVTGTLDSSGNLNLSIALPGGTATVTAALPTNLRSKTAATWQIVGGPCAMPTTAVHIEQFAPLTGAYTEPSVASTSPPAARSPAHPSP